jgi:phosphoglucomutase
MRQDISPFAGKALPKEFLVDIGRLLAAYADVQPDPA